MIFCFRRCVGMLKNMTTRRSPSWLQYSFPRPHNSGKAVNAAIYVRSHLYALIRLWPLTTAAPEVNANMLNRWPG
jgi:hypothetical protein